MKKVFGVILIAVVATFGSLAPAWASSVDERIKALEEELLRLKAEQQQVRTDQMEFKRLATEAAAALPSFSYRPRAGMTIAAADKSWAFNIGSEFNVRMYNHVDGNDSDGAQSGKLFGRRFRIFTNYCWSNCFYDFDLQIDMDQNNIPLELQRAQLDFHFNQFNPFLPTLRVGLDAAASTSHLVSSRNSARWERPNINDNSSVSVTGSHQGIGLVWDGVPVGTTVLDLESHLVTGRIAAGDSATTQSDKMGWIGYFGAKPFEKPKNKWLNGLEFRFMVQMEPIDDRGGVAADAGGAGAGIYRRQRLRTDERIGRFTIIDTGNNAIGKGLHYFLQPALIYRIGPYTLNALFATSRWQGEEDNFRGVKASGFEIANELYLWSPKGLFTGRSTVPGSVLFGWAFERSDMDCGVGSDCAPGAGAFRQAYLIQREMNLTYTVLAGLRLGLQWNWWRSSNTPVAVQSATNCSGNTNTGNVGKSCEWHTVNASVHFNW